MLVLSGDVSDSHFALLKSTFSFLFKIMIDIIFVLHQVIFLHTSTLPVLSALHPPTQTLTNKCTQIDLLQIASFDFYLNTVMWLRIIVMYFCLVFK